MKLSNIMTILAIAASVVALPQQLVAGHKMMTVQIRKGQLRSSPSFLSRVVATANYATRVTVLEDKGSWLKVRPLNGSSVGWMHASALTKKKLKLAAGEKNASTAVSTDEQALAGKGFNSDVEAKFKQENKNIDFTWVNRMEKIKISPQQAKKFLNDGDIKPKKGAE